MFKFIFIILLSIFFIGCEDVNNSSVISNIVKEEIDNGKYHGTYCNKYSALYYVSKTHGGYYTLTPVFKGDGTIVACDNPGKL